MKHVVVLCLFLCGIATAQMQLVQVVGPGSEKEVPAVLSLGAIPVGENVSITLRVRNTSQAALVHSHAGTRRRRLYDERPAFASPSACARLQHGREHSILPPGLWLV